MKAAGLDGWKKGWVAVVVKDGVFDGASLFRSISDALAELADAQAIAVDVPIGLPIGRDPRRADVEAQRFVGARKRSVFETFPRRVMEALTHREAVALARELTGRGISRQSHALRLKIFEAEKASASDDRIHEMHPEVSFRALASRSLSSKKSWAGFHERVILLAAAGIVVPTAELGPAERAGADDVLDAASAAWTAHRIARGEALTLPAEPERDRRGRAVAIWY